MPDLSLLLQTLLDGIHLAFVLWWVWFPALLVLAAYAAWFDYKRTAYLSGLKWSLLEILLPPDVPKSSPRLAESLFSALHASYGGGTSWKSQFFQGKVPDWFSFEVVSNGGETHFFIRCPEAQRNVIESLIFSQYPNAEIHPAEDYVKLLPDAFDANQYDVSGTEFEFSKEAAYPIRVYEEFEDAGGKDEHARIDPIAPLVEMMSALQPGEYLWLQYVLRATGGDWVKENQKVVDKLMGKEEKKPDPSFIEWIFSGIDGLLGVTKAEEKKEEKKQFSVGSLSPTDKDTLERAQKKLSKLAFKVGIRALYTARKESFNGTRMAGLNGMFKQLYANNLNSFKPANGTRDKGVLSWIFPNDKGFFANERTLKKKNDMYGAYRKRVFPFKLVILTTEELATLWHLPGLNVKAPLLPRVQAKKGQPPAILPTR